MITQAGEHLTPRASTSDGDRTVIFLHIGKTAGTTLRRVLQRQFPRARVLIVPPAGASARGVNGRPASPREQSLEAFARIPLEQRRDARLIMGHTIFGVHDLVPRPSTYITMLRDPMRLVPSQYRYIKHNTRHRLHETVVSKGMTLEDYVVSGVSINTNNSQTRALAGDTATPFGSTGAMLDEARAHLVDRFAFVGITELFDESLVRLQDVFGWSPLHYVAANVTLQPTSANEIGPAARRRIEELNQLDLELYHSERDRFEQWMHDAPGFAARVDDFRRANQRQRPWIALTQTAPREVRRRVARLRGSA
jgi:hypothetical protein